MAENVQQVLAAKMTVYGFIDQAIFFLENLKSTILSSPGGINAEGTALLLESSQQAISYALEGLSNYQKIREASRAVVKLRKTAAANDNANEEEEEGEGEDFIINRPTVSASKSNESIDLNDYEGEFESQDVDVDSEPSPKKEVSSSETPKKVTDKKLN
jgi:hypothetical protein